MAAWQDVFRNPKDLIRLVRELSDAGGQRLAQLALRFSDGEITPAEFLRLAAVEIRNLHMGAAIAALGSPDRLETDTMAAVAVILQNQFYAGKDPVSGRVFGLKHLMSGLMAGMITLPQFQARLGMYARSARYTADYVQIEQVKRTDSQKIYAVRNLGTNDNHCAECVEYSRRPPERLSTIVMPGTQCSCLTNCLCSLQFLTLEEAVMRGMERPT